MPRHKPIKKKRYKPSTANPLSIYATLGKVRGFDEQSKTDIKLPVRISFENMRKTDYGFDDICTLYCAIRIGIRCANLLDEKLQATNLQAKERISKIHDQFIELNSPPELNESDFNLFLDSVEIYEAIVELITPNQMTQILSDIKEEMLA